MLLKLATFCLAAICSATEWEPTLVNITSSWPANEFAVGHASHAGGRVQFFTDSALLKNGTGSCDIALGTAGVNFVHFENAHVGLYTGGNTWTIYALQDWENSGSFSFTYLADEEPVDADIAITCQNDLGLNTGTPLLSSFPQSPDNDSASGSFSAKDLVFPASVVLSFNAGEGPLGMEVMDPNLTATQQDADTWTIEGLENVNYEDVWFNLDYTNSTVTSAYHITILDADA